MSESVALSSCNRPEFVIFHWVAPYRKGQVLHSVSAAAQARADKKRIAELERELRRNDKALAETAAILVLRRKMNAFWGNGSEDV